MSNEARNYDDGAWLPPGCVVVNFMGESESTFSTPTVIADYNLYVRDHYGNEES